MTKANECTCPSGDGSLRHPCPAHPASVELAGVAANLTFINGRPAMCGCQVEYSSGGGEYSDVIYVTLCAKHSGSAILDLVATNRIALTPEYEGQWHADLYLDREIPLAKAEGATPAEAVLALMSAERIDPEQGGVDQAGGDRWDALQSIMEWTAAENVPDDRKLCLIRNAARAALAQPSPKCATCNGSKVVSTTDTDHNGDYIEAPCPKCGGTGEADSGGVHPWGEPVLIPCDCETEKAEAERPVVVARLYRSNDLTMTPFAEVQKPLPLPASDGTLTVDALMTVAQHERIVEARWNRAMDLMGEHVARISEKLKTERDAALARVAEMEKQEPVALANRGIHAFWVKWTEAAAGLYGPGIKLYAAPVVQAQQLNDLDKQCRDDVARALGLRPNQERGFAWSYLLASIKSCVKASGDSAQAQHSVPETTNEEANSFLRVADAGQFKDNAAAVRTAAMIIRGLLHSPAIMKSIIRHRIGLTPEYEGQWHADLYGEDGEVQHHAEADTPDEAVRAVVALAAAPGKEGV
ncbi:hypothetical protein ACX11Q_006022 [Pseudomonas aeruginosa]